jgi:hypothetical protein
MPHSRLADLEQYKSSDVSNDIAITISPGANEMGQQVEDYFEEVHMIQSLLSAINAALDNLKKV